MYMRKANASNLRKGGLFDEARFKKVRCSLPVQFYSVLRRLKEKPLEEFPLFGTIPNKLRACEYLVDHHEKQGRKIVVFSDQLYVLALYSKKLKKPAITVDTSKGERTYILREFRHGEKVDTIFVSEIDYSNADVEVDVVIQLCYEELIAVNAQPLGLLLGGKATSGDGGLNPLYFYFLVSDDVKQEIDWFDKLKEFYVHQGYAFEQAEDLPPKNYFNLSFETEESNLSFCKIC